MSGGANFSPRLNPRPQYPPFTEVFGPTLLKYIRVPIILTMLTRALYPYYITMVEHFYKRGWEDRWIFAVTISVLHTLCYILMGGFYLYCEKTGFLMEYKFKRKKHQIPTRKMMTTLFQNHLLAQLVTGPIAAYILFPVFVYSGTPSLDSPLPSFFHMYRAFCTSMLVNEVGFYWSHRLVHHPALYGWIHKQHHTFTGTVSVAAEFASPIEQIISNQLPTVGGQMFFGCHGSYLIFMVWVVARLAETYEGHSGFCFYGTFLQQIGFTYSHTAAYHDFHHTGNRGNFGSAWLDWTFGTMDAWADLGGMQGYLKQTGFTKNPSKAPAARRA